METVQTRIWREEPEPDNPFAVRVAYCRGYDVYGEMLGQARWVEMLYLLFREEAPTAAQADLLEALAVALANPGPRDASVHAAMCGSVCGSTAAASLMAALAVGAGQLAGGPIPAPVVPPAFDQAPVA
jgi:citrate synthase